MIASRSGAVGSGGTLRYLLADHLGSTTAQVNAADGTVASAVRYWPFGAERSGTAPERGYTGQQKEPLAPLGMYYYRARFYSTATAHFVSADPTPGSGLNRYNYAAANPVRHNDPTGYTLTQSDIDRCAADLAACLALSASSTPVPTSAAGPTPVPVPTPKVDPIAACGRNIASCLLWSAGGDWASFINTVAAAYGVPADALAAIILWEMENVHLDDLLEEEALNLALKLGLPVGKLGLDRVSVGLSQIQFGNARSLEDLGLVPQASDLETFRRLVDPAWAVIYAAAYMADTRKHIPSARRGSNSDYVLLWRTDPENYSTWLEGNAPNTQNIVDHYNFNDAVSRLAVDLAQQTTR